MATTPDLQEPQIAAARAKAWHQAGEPLLTLEAARTFINDCGLLLFAPRPALGAPAPSLVEATLGDARPGVTLTETQTARTLVARLVGEGSAIPLNLLGGPGDLPDFVVSAQAFPFVFTLRGDKGWKRPPETSGAVKVTPLALRVYELLAERGALTVADMVPEIGREVTESAVSRSLSELWQLLRVLPVLQQGEGDTLWELATTRFIKAVKAGANAGQPTALSALVSTYLTQAYIATEEEIAAFLSPLTARSRVRDVLHGLSAGRQLSEAVLNGKTVLYVPDALPDFAEFETPEAEATADESEAQGEATAAEEGSQPERIRRFGQDKGPQDRNLRGKPVRREGSREGARPSGERPSRGAAGSRRTDDRRSTGAGRGPTSRPDRSARRTDESGERRRPAADRPSYSRPWDEERSSRPPRRPEGTGSDRPTRPYADRQARPPREDRADRGPRPSRDRQEGRPPRRDQDAGERPSFRRREFPPRSQEGQGSDRSQDRRPAARGDRPQRPFRERSAEGTRPDRPFRERPAGGARPDRPFRERSGEGARPDRPFRPRPAEGTRPDRPFRPRPAEGARPDRPFRPRQGDGPEGGFRERRAPGARPAGGRDDRPGSTGGPARGGRPAFGGAQRGRPQAGAGGRQGSRPGGDRGGSFKGGPGRPGAKSAGRPPRPSRPAPRPKPEDEA